MKMYVKQSLKIFFITLVIFFEIKMFSQTTKIELKVDTNQILIGDQINLTIELTKKIGEELLFPEFGSAITKTIEVIQKHNKDTQQVDENYWKITQQYLVTSFDSGLQFIPEVTTFAVKGDTIDSLYSNTAFIFVVTDTVDVTQDFKGIKDPLSIPFSLKEILSNILLIFGLTVLILLAIYFIIFRKKDKIRKKEVKKTKLSAQAIALKSLYAMDELKEWNTTQHKKYYSKLTDTLRTYLENRFTILAMEQTTPEIVEALGTVHIQKAIKNKLEKILELADLVKFAKFIPKLENNKNTMEEAIYFVKETMINEENNQQVETTNNEQK